MDVIVQDAWDASLTQIKVPRAGQNRTSAHKRVAMRHLSYSPGLIQAVEIRPSESNPMRQYSTRCSCCTAKTSTPPSPTPTKRIDWIGPASLTSLCSDDNWCRVAS